MRQQQIALIICFLLVPAIAIGIQTGASGTCSAATLSRFPLYFALVGLLISLVRRFRSSRPKGDKSLINVILNDFRFQSYATPSVLSLIYAIIQGSCFGAATGFLGYAFGMKSCFGGMTYSWDTNGIPFVYTQFSDTQALALSGLLALIVLFSRIALETYALVYRVAQDISRCTRKDDLTE